VLVMTMSPAKINKPTEIKFGVLTRVVQRSSKLDWGTYRHYLANTNE